MIYYHIYDFNPQSSETTNNFYHIHLHVYGGESEAQVAMEQRAQKKPNWIYAIVPSTLFDAPHTLPFWQIAKNAIKSHWL